MKKTKPDLINTKEFVKLTDQKDVHHDPPHDEIISDDENNDPFNETLLGMEYDLDSVEEVDEDHILDEDEEYLLAEEDTDEDEYDEREQEFND